MDERITEVLARKALPPDLEEFTEEVKQCFEMSHDRISQYYDTWDRLYQSYAAERVNSPKDKERNAKAKGRGEPEKMVIPVTYAQVDTFVAFAMTLLTQNEHFFELIPTGVEDEPGAAIGSALLQRDLEKSDFFGDQLVQFLTDLAVFNLAILKHSWHEDRVTERQVLPDGTVQDVDRIVYQGNKFCVVSPYRFFPDPRLPLSKAQEGEFMGSIEEYSHHSMQEMQRDGVIAGVEHVEPTKDPAQVHSPLYRYRLYSSNDVFTAGKFKYGSTNHPYVVMELQKTLIPSKTMIDGKPLGTSDRPEKWLIWLVNNEKIVRLEKLDYPHEGFTFDVGLFNYNQNVFLSFGMAELISQLQDVMTWFINSRITSVRRVIQNTLIADPKAINMQDLEERNPVIRINPAFQGMGVDRFLKQLQLQDVTTGHVGDIQLLNGFVRESTGITENLMGMFAPGRRSAAEARNVNSNAVARAKKPIKSVFEKCFKAAGRKALLNLRSGLSEEQVVRTIGTNVDPAGMAQYVTVRPEDLQGNYDFKIFDATLPSEKAQQADVLERVFETLAGQPQLAQMFNINMQAVFFEIIKLRGIRNVERFQGFPGQSPNGMGGPPGQPGAVGGPPGLPAPM